MTTMTSRSASTLKQVMRIASAHAPHWVGDGFPVRSLFNYQGDVGERSPFLMLDYGGPTRFAPAERPRGVGGHPHRGFETVTIVYQGELAHRDSTGAGGLIGPGDVQWMTAGAGILHDEFHSDTFTRDGGVLEFVQLWVNLPAAHKHDAPGYQTLLDRDIPAVSLANGAGQLRVIAGSHDGHDGPAQTRTPINLWDLQLVAGAGIELDVPDGHTTIAVLQHGAAAINAQHDLDVAQAAFCSRSGNRIELNASADSRLLILAGEPIDEPVVAYGPFVMNRRDEIETAILDFQAGRFGRLG